MGTTLITSKQIEAWKKQHGDIYEIIVEDKKCYLKSPDRKTLSYAMTVGQNKPIELAEAILNNCWLGGDEEIKLNDQYFFAAASKIDELIQLKQAEIKKL